MTIKIKTTFFLICICGFFLSSCSPKIEESSNYYLYFSDSMDKFKTTGVVISVGDKTEVVKKTDGLELGRLIIQQKEVTFSDVNNTYMFDSEQKKIKTKEREFKEFTGQYFSVLNGQPIQVFNSGYNDHNEYITRFYFDNNVLEINEFMKSMGKNTDSLFSIGEEDDRDTYVISQYIVKNDKLERVKLGEIPRNEDEFFIGDLMFFNDSLYVLYEKNNLVQLLEYNINSSTSTIIDINSSMSVNDIPFANSNFSIILEDKFFFISSIGDLYQYDLTKKEMVNTHHLDLDFSTNFVVDWGQKGTATIASYNTNQDILISSFNLDQFKIKTLKEIKISSLVSSGYLYDFKVMADN